MINNVTQLGSWLIAIIIGIIYYFVLKFIILKINSNNIFIRIFIDIFYIFISSFLIIKTYYYFNGGYIHYGYLLFFAIGYFISRKVNNSVKRLKKTIFLKK